MVFLIDEAVSNSDTDSDEEKNENTIASPISPSSIQFPFLFGNNNINVRNAYAEGKYICSEFILMTEHKETIVISCFTKKVAKVVSGM